MRRFARPCYECLSVDILLDINQDMSTEILREYPWLSYQLRLEQLTYVDWLLLGDAQSKCEQLIGEPLLPAAREELQRIYLAKGVQATTAIEGNTLSEEQVQQYIAGTLRLPISQEYLAQEVDNVLVACNAVLAQMQKGSLPPLTIEQILGLNHQLLNGLASDDLTVPGEIRGHTVRVGPYLPPAGDQCRALLQRLVEWLGQEWGKEPNMLAFGILKAIVAHLYLAWIHPFGDGNGRTARMVELYLLLGAGVPSAAAQLLSNHYNKTRTEYYRQLDRASKGSDPIPFIRYALQGFVDGLREQLLYVQSEQIKVHWRDYVHAVFGNNQDATSRRRLALLLALSENAGTVAIGAVRRIAPQIAEFYAGKSDKTIRRDLEDLEERNLIEVSKGEVQVLKRQLLESQGYARNLRTR